MSTPLSDADFQLNRDDAQDHSPFDPYAALQRATPHPKPRYRARTRSKSPRLAVAVALANAAGHKGGGGHAHGDDADEDGFPACYSGPACAGIAHGCYDCSILKESDCAGHFDAHLTNLGYCAEGTEPKVAACYRGPACTAAGASHGCYDCSVTQASQCDSSFNDAHQLGQDAVGRLPVCLVGQKELGAAVRVGRGFILRNLWDADQVRPATFIGLLRSAYLPYGRGRDSCASRSRSAK